MGQPFQSASQELRTATCVPWGSRLFSSVLSPLITGSTKKLFLLKVLLTR